MTKSKSNSAITEDKSIENAIEKSLAIFEKDIKNTIDYEFEKYLHKNTSLKSAAYDSIEGGKHIRAFSTILFYKLAGGKKKEYKKVAAAMELIHCASLIIDDEIDKVDFRPDRNAPSIRGKYTPEEASGIAMLEVLYATHLLFEGTDHLKQNKKEKIRHLFVKLVSDGETGEIFKWKFTQQRKIPSKKQYWKELLGPTAALFFQLTGEIGAIIATDNQKLIEKTSSLAYKMGELLQAGDDLKDLKEDLRDGFYALPVINHYESLKGKEKKEFAKKLSYKLSEKALTDIYYEVIYSKTMDLTISEIKKVGQDLIDLLIDFPETEEKKSLIKIITYLKDRMKLVN